MDKERYNRHIILPEIGLEGQDCLNKAKVLVVGAGGLGSPVLLYLVAAGVGTIGIVDDDVVSLSNLQRQVLYRTDEIGLAKVDCAKATLLSNNPTICIETFKTRLNKQNALNIAEPYQLIVDCTDNYASRYLISDVSEKLSIPMVYGSISQFSGQVSVFNYKGSKSYKQLFEAPPFVDDNDSARLGVIGALPGVIGSIQAVEAVKIILNFPEVLANKLFLFDCKTMQSNIVNY